MRIIKAPDDYLVQPDEFVAFLGGGITKCDDWQWAIGEQLTQAEPDSKWVLLNPRAESWPEDEKSHARQISWEWEGLHTANLVVLWFCSTSVCPITLLELGAALERSRDTPLPPRQVVLVGFEEGYVKERDVHAQILKYAKKNVHTVWGRLGDLRRSMQELMRALESAKPVGS